MTSTNTNKILPDDFIPEGRIYTSLKVLTLGLVSLLLIATDWVLIHKALYTDKELVFWVWPSLSMAATIGFITLFTIVNYSRTLAWTFAALVLASYWYIFPKAFLVYAGGLIFILLLFWFEQRVRSEEKSRQDFSIRRVSSASISVIIYGFLLLLCLNIYHNTSAEFKANPDHFYETLGRSASKSARYLGGGEKAGIDFTQTINQYLETETKERLPDYEDLPEIQRQQFINEARDQFFEQFNVTGDGDQPLSEVVANFAVGRIRSSAERFPDLFPLIFTLIILALLRTFSFVFKWIALLFTWIVFIILLKLGFFRLVKVPIEVQKLEV